MNAQRAFLQTNGDLFLRWDRGSIVIESYYAKQFDKIGGDTNRLIACFEDNGEMTGAIEDYFQRETESGA